jgi:hypothetical protein
MPFPLFRFQSFDCNLTFPASWVKAAPPGGETQLQKRNSCAPTPVPAFACALVALKIETVPKQMDYGSLTILSFRQIAGKEA